MSAIAATVLDVLFASVWQGALVMLGAGLLLAVCGRRLNAATRALALQGSLAVVALLPIVTIVPRLAGHAFRLEGDGLANVSAARPSTDLTSWVFSGPHTIELALGDPIIFALAMLWLAGVVAYGAQIIIGILQLGRLTRRSTHLTDRGGVGVYASHDIEVPLAVGFATPRVLVPSAIARAADPEFECIVLHELAHISRGDAWANACERVVHAMLFFNPSVIVLLRAIALEREAACDDRAVAASHDLDTYTKSLATFAIFGARRTSVALCGTSGFGRATLARIQRLEDARRNGATSLSRIALGGTSLMLLAISLSLASLAPAVAFAPRTSTPVITPDAAVCTSPARYMGGPGPATADTIPNGLSTKIRVSISPEGKVTGTTVIKASGNGRFDSEVIASVMSGTWSPAVADCKPVAGSYVFLARTGP